MLVASSICSGIRGFEVAPGDSMPKLPKALEAKIKEAFQGRERPNEAALLQRAPDDGVRAYYRGKSWQDILRTKDDLEPRDAIPDLTFEGFVYYLPAFLILALDADDPLEVGDALVFHLWSFTDWVAEKLRPAEKRVVVQVLEYLAEEWRKRGEVNNLAAVALDHYWAYFTDEELGIS